MGVVFRWWLLSAVVACLRAVVVGGGCAPSCDTMQTNPPNSKPLERKPVIFQKTNVRFCGPCRCRCPFSVRWSWAVGARLSAVVRAVVVGPGARPNAVRAGSVRQLPVKGKRAGVSFASVRVRAWAAAGSVCGFGARRCCRWGVRAPRPPIRARVCPGPQLCSSREHFAHGFGPC